MSLRARWHVVLVGRRQRLWLWLWEQFGGRQGNSPCLRCRWHEHDDWRMPMRW